MNPKVLWKPNDEFIENSHIFHFIKWLKEEKGLHFKDYHSLWEWSVEEFKDFWLNVVEYFNLDIRGEYRNIASDDVMWKTKWFEGAKVSYAQHIFRNENTDNPAIIFGNETGGYLEISWEELKMKVASFAAYLKSLGVGKGDAVCAFLPNVPEATIAFLAVNSIGAIWSSTSPDFGVDSVVDRFAQIEPKVFIGVNGYIYNGKPYNKIEVVKEIFDQLPTVKQLILLKYLDDDIDSKTLGDFVDFKDCLKGEAELTFELVEFNDPIWVLYSSGTTGLPKAITHSVGGVLLEHIKYLAFHNDVHKGERFFWYSTTGWMMWNFVQASFLMGATVVLYEGSPAFPDISKLWDFAEKAKINHFGTSAPFIVACMKFGIKPKENYNLSGLRSISSTGAPLPPEGFDWIYENVKTDVWLASISGGTDVCTAFVGGNPLWPVHEGEIQCRALGAAVYAFDIDGLPVYDEVGEMVITKPMPSMPIYFWNDPNGNRYEDSYFSHYKGIWRHGDWIKINSKTKGLVILGRSDATLNRHGVRIGTAEIYRAIDLIPEIKDSLIVNLELDGGKHYMPLFVLMNDGFALDDAIKAKIKSTLKKEYTPRHVPDEIIEVKDLPYTISGKKMEAPVKKILLGFDLKKAINIDSMRNPESIEFFVEYAKEIG